jgi:hypothetical protein
MPEQKYNKAYRSLSIRLLVDDYDRFEKARKFLQEKAEAAGVKTTVSKPELLNHLVQLFFEKNQNT